jgi:hypothetical protein
MAGRTSRRRVRPARAAAAMVAALGASWLGVGSLNVATAGAAGASGCAFHLVPGPILGALGSYGINFRAVPNGPAETCTTTFSATASITGPGGVKPTNVNSNPLTSTFTVTFSPNRLGPLVGWLWSPHCADPANVPYTFTATSAAGGVAGVPLPPESCSEQGAPGLTSRITDPITESPDLGSVAGIAATPGNLGYSTVALEGSQFGFGDATQFNIAFSNAPVVGIANAGDGSSNWQVSADGGVFSFGNAHFYGSMGGIPLNSPVVGMASTPDHGGYWLVAADGGIFSFGDAVFHGSMGGQPLNQPIVGMTSTPDGQGYWLVAADGGIFAFGDAVFHGSMGGIPLNAPVTGMAANTAGGYWLVATDGGIFSFDATFFGSTGGIALNAPISGMAASSDGNGYWFVGADNGVFAFGDAPFHGSGPVAG